MFAILSGLINGVTLAILLTAAVWLALRLTPRRNLNAATRYVIWWVTLAAVVLIPISFMPFLQVHRSAPPIQVHSAKAE